MNKKNDIRLLRIQYLRGPNIWTYRAALETWLDLGELEDHPSNTLPGMVRAPVRLAAGAGRSTTAASASAAASCSGCRKAPGAATCWSTWSSNCSTWPACPPASARRAAPASAASTAWCSAPATSRWPAPRWRQGHRLLMCAINDEPFDVPAAVAAVRETIDDCYLGPSTAAIVAAATDRRIPHIRLNDGNLVQLGHGRAAAPHLDRRDRPDQRHRRGHRPREGPDQAACCRRWACRCPRARSVASAGRSLGGGAGHRPAGGGQAHRRQPRPRRHARPERAGRGRGRLGAWPTAKAARCIVERYIRGDEHRLLVVGGKVVAAARGETAWVTGDGRASVAELIDAQINTDPRRGTTEDHPLNRLNPREDGVILLDLQRQGLTPDSVPAAGRRVLIQRNGNVAIDCTDDVHPEVAHVVSLAARTVGLDIAGIDVVAEDIGKPLQDAGWRGGRGQRRPRAADAPAPGRRRAAAGGPGHRRPPVPRRRGQRPHPDRRRGRLAPHHADRPAGGLGDAAGRARTSAWPAATGCSSTAAASRPATAPTGTPAGGC